MELCSFIQPIILTAKPSSPPPNRHPREGGDPSPDTSSRADQEMDSRLRGSDDGNRQCPPKPAPPASLRPQPQYLPARIRQTPGKAETIPHPRDQRDKDRLTHFKFADRPRHIA